MRTELLVQYILRAASDKMTGSSTPPNRPHLSAEKANMETSSHEIRQWLASPQAHPDSLGTVEVCETHISWVLLTDRFAFKLKKPVAFDFLDFSTIELRRQACLQELELNRRLAPDVYLEVLPIYRVPGGTYGWSVPVGPLGGGPMDGELVDWVVKMRRLAANDAMDHLIRQGELTPDDEQRVADYLATFYQGISPAPITGDDYRHNFVSRVEENLHELTSTMPDHNQLIRRIHSLQLRMLRVDSPEFDRRVDQGRIVEGHGDLRPDHVYLEQPPAIIDCIEFSSEFRTVDVADELSFLDMECQRLGNITVGPRLLAAWLQASGDDVPDRLYAFYGSYRACVRAKVAVLRQQQLAQRDQSADLTLPLDYLHLAERLAQPLGQPVLLIIGGLSGTGKSTLARSLASELGIDILSTDSIRQQLLGPSPTPAGYGQGHYDPQQRTKVYQQLASRAQQQLSHWLSLIVDGTFLTHAQREQMFELARQHGAAALFVECHCDRATAIARITRRAAEGKSDSEARGEFYDLQASQWTPPTIDQPHAKVDTTWPGSRQTATVYDALRNLLYG